MSDPLPARLAGLSRPRSPSGTSQSLHTHGFQVPPCLPQVPPSMIQPIQLPLIPESDPSVTLTGPSEEPMSLLHGPFISFTWGDP